MRGLTQHHVSVWDQVDLLMLLQRVDVAAVQPTDLPMPLIEGMRHVLGVIMNTPADGLLLLMYVPSLPGFAALSCELPRRPSSQSC